MDEMFSFTFDAIFIAILESQSSMENKGGN